MGPLTRRDFLGTLSIAIGTLALSRTGQAAPAGSKPRVGCQANGFTLKAGEFPGLLAALVKMKELGYAGFECNVRFVEGEFGNVADARKRIEDTGVEFIGAHMNMTQGKTDAFPRTVEKLAALGATAIVMSGSGLAANGVFTADAVHEKAASLEALGQTCRKGGLWLTYHNHNPEFANRNAEINALANATSPENLRFLMDAGHAKLGGGDPAAFMTKHSARILGCHLKTYRELVQVPLGQGDWDFADLAAAIRATGWSGWLITEEGGGPRAGNTAALGPDREYIRKVFGA
ncbi:MAG TPA: sugar phosphate isomerase/epimerase [Opitutaceae bacterium]|nr:sugar phosphate isomerase/epimerase [Opitutaceae bacterium]